MPGARAARRVALRTILFRSASLSVTLISWGGIINGVGIDRFALLIPMERALGDIPARIPRRAEHTVSLEVSFLKSQACLLVGFAAAY